MRLVRRPLQWIQAPVREIFLEEQKVGIGLLHSLWLRGWRGKVAVAALLGLWGVAGLEAFAPTGLGRWIALLQPWLSFNVVVGFALLATLLVVNADWMPWWARMLLHVYVLLYFAYPLLGTVPSWLLALPVVAFYVWEMATHRPPTGPWVAWTLALAQFPPHVPLPSAWPFAVRFLVGTLVNAVLLGGIGWAMRRTESRRVRQVRYPLVAAGLIVPYIWGWVAQATTLEEQLFFSIQAMWGLTIPLWLWLGADLIGQAGRVAEFLGKRVPRLLLSAYVPFLVVLLGLWLSVNFLASFLEIDLVAPGLLWLFAPLRVVERVLPEEGVLTLWWAGPTLIVLGGIGVWRARRVADVELFGRRYLALIAAALLFLYMFAQEFLGAGEAEGPPTMGWPFLAVAANLLWEQTKAVRQMWEEEETVWFSGTVALLFLAVTLALFARAPEMVDNYSTVYVILGAVTWGVPALLVAAFAGEEDVPEWLIIRSFLLGYFLVWPLAILWPTGGPWLAPLALGVGLLTLERRATEGRLTSLWPWAVGLMAAGTVAYLVAPALIMVPVLPLAAPLLARLYRLTPLPFFGYAHVMVALAGLMVTVGIVWARRWQPRRRWPAWVALLLLWGLWNRWWWPA